MHLEETEEKRENTQAISRHVLRRKVKILAAVTAVSVCVAASAVIAAILIWLYYHNGTQPVKVSDRADVTAESARAGYYSQPEVDALIDTATKNTQEKTSRNLLSDIQKKLEGGASFMDLLRSLYPANIVMVDSNQYYFLPVNDSLKKNTYQDENFVQDDSGIVTYQENGTVTSHMGIDVSKYQGVIDWNAVKSDGVEYAIIRVGVRGYSEGAIMADDTFQQNIEGALASGLKVGVYFFSEAVSDAEAQEEAQFVLDQIKNYDVTCPVYLDVEDVKKDSSRTKNLTAEERTTYSKTFLETIAAAGYQPGIYGNLKTFALMLDMTQLEQYPKWLASYSLPVYFPYAYDSLQYTESGKIAGIDEDIDLNISFKDISAAK